MAAKVKMASDASVAQIFDAMAGEIEVAGDRCLKLDIMVDELMGVLPIEKVAPLLQGMHAIDQLSQQLACLSAFAREMSGAVTLDARAPVDAALKVMTHRDMADRLGLNPGAHDKIAHDADEAEALGLL